MRTDEIKCPECSLRWFVGEILPDAVSYKCDHQQLTKEHNLTVNKRVEPDIDGYEGLKRVLNLAYDQSAKGKGKERHANDKAFDEQPIMTIARMVGVGGHSYQICKKAQEATTMTNQEKYKAAKAEFLGAIVYAAAAYLLIEEIEK